MYFHCKSLSILERVSLFLQVSNSWHSAFWSCICGTFLHLHSKEQAQPLSRSSHLSFSFPSLQAIWENQFYYLFGFLFLVFVILVIACSEVSIVMTYFQLCGEDYNWWWRSFFLSGSASYYVLAYSIIYFFTKVYVRIFLNTYSLHALEVYPPSPQIVWQGGALQLGYNAVLLIALFLFICSSKLNTSFQLFSTLATLLSWWWASGF